MANLTNTVGGKCDNCGHHQKYHSSRKCDKCDCGNE